MAYAIPCPDRRTSGNWVLDAVPLLPGKDAVTATVGAALAATAPRTAGVGRG